MPSNTAANPEHRRRRTAFRSLGIASAAAFAGGVAVVGVQYALGLVSAGYPPIVQGLVCSMEGERNPSGLSVASEGTGMLPVAEFQAGSLVTCRIEAPGADYATWSIVGPEAGVRSAPLDPQLACQSPEAFAEQDPSLLRLSACQRFEARQPGLYLLSITVMQRGQHAVDRARMLIRILPAAVAPPEAAIPRNERLSVTLRLPATRSELQREVDLSASFAEHGLMPQSRGFERTVYRLAPDEAFLGATFRVRSAANASAVELRHVPESRSVTARFTLRSGPVVDRWRGWVSGSVIVRVEQHRAARDVALPDTDLPVPGRVELPLPDEAATLQALILLRRPDMATGIEIAPGGTARLDQARVSARILEGRLVLETSPE